jgi:hypothetical protein
LPYRLSSMVLMYLIPRRRSFVYAPAVAGGQRKPWYAARRRSVAP